MLDRKTAAFLVSQSLKNIFAFCMSRLYDRDSAEDLTNDIVCEVLKSAHRLKDDAAFHAYMWRIADNTFKKRIRGKNQSLPFDEAFMGVYWDTTDDDMADAQDLFTLRRELSLLTKQYREVTVAYYIYGKRCSDIARELNISPEMVKYCLFKTRKTLKEGFGMTRPLGEKSYNPGVFRMDYWGGGDNACYWNLFRRKLPGSILLAAYDAAMTIGKLSVELGVAVPYLEDEIEPLIKHELLAKSANKYQTNIIIFTDACEKQVAACIKPIYDRMAEKVSEGISSVLPQLKALDFKGNDYSENRLRWTFTNLAMVFALKATDEKQRGFFGDYPPLTNGSYGFVFGYDNDYENHHYNGIYSHHENDEKTAYFSAHNYRVIESCQNWKPVGGHQSIKAMTDAILEQNADTNNDMLVRYIDEGFIKSDNGRLSAAFPVFDADVLESAVYSILKPLSEQISDCMINICDAAAAIVKDHAPKALQAKCGQLAAIHYQMDVAAWIVETMVDKRYLNVPTANEKLCVFGVKR